jgi:uncharacterized membrane protein
VSAVILAVIVVMWAVVLVPMWLRRHDAATETRSADKFSAAMRVLSRRQPAGKADRRYVLMPRRDAGVAVHVSGAAARVARPLRATRPVPAAAAAAVPVKEPRPARVRGQRPSLAIRRRRAFLSLAGVTFLTFVLALAGAMGWVLQLVIDLVLVAFIVHLRTQVKRTRELAHRRRQPIAATARPAAPVPAPAYAETASPATAPPAYADPVASPAVVEEAEPAAATGTDDVTAWEPIPVPRPTYTMKPPAPPRRYPPVQADSDVAPEAAQPAAAASDEAVSAGDDGQLDEILTRRWAVND